MGESRTPAGFPPLSKPTGGKITRHLRKTTKDLGKTTKHLGKTIRHLVFPGCFPTILQVTAGVTKKAIKPPLNIVYIKVLGHGRAGFRPAKNRRKAAAHRKASCRRKQNTHRQTAPVSSHKYLGTNPPYRAIYLPKKLHKRLTSAIHSDRPAVNSW